MSDPDGIIDPETGLPRVLSRRCDTCIFRRDNPMHLREGRREQMTTDAVRNGSWIICHDTLPYGQNADFGNAICRGFWNDPQGSTSGGVQMAQRFAEMRYGSGKPYPAQIDPPTTT